MLSAGTGRFIAGTKSKMIGRTPVPEAVVLKPLTKSMTLISAESATLEMPFWTGSTGSIQIEVIDMGNELTIPILDTIDAEIASMTEDEINAEIDAMFGAWKDRPELTVESLTNIWEVWAKHLSKIDHDESEDHSV